MNHSPDQVAGQQSSTLLLRQIILRLPQAVAGLALAAFLAAVPYLFLFYDPPNTSTTQVLNILLVSASGVLLIGLPAGIACVLVLRRSDLLSMRAVILSGLLVPLMLGCILVLASGLFGLFFIPGLVIAGLVMALTYWLWIHRPLDERES